MSSHIPVNEKGFTVVYEGEHPTVEYVLFQKHTCILLPVLDSN
jgi:hypothetical protein